MLSQLDTSSTCELRVKSENVDCKLHLVDDALTGRLSLIPEFEVLRAIVGSRTVFVMDCFARLQRAAKNFFHHYSMEKFLRAATIVQPNISRRMLVSVGVYGAPLSAFVPTVAAAKALFRDVARMTAVFCATHLPRAGFAAEFALESRGWFLVHEGQLTQPGQAVKETVLCPFQA